MCDGSVLFWRREGKQAPETLQYNRIQVSRTIRNKCGRDTGCQAEANSKHSTSELTMLTPTPLLRLRGGGGTSSRPTVQLEIDASVPSGNARETSKAMLELLGDKLLSSSGNVMTVEALKGKAVGLYFSAHWCPPCRGFTPKLTQVYKSLKAS